ncbi:MAG: NAD(P)H-dependent flavin oxidoreductase [Acidimicrobiales bacterium]
MNGDPKRLCDVLGIARPVLCAPMAGIAGGRLAAAVSQAGGFGLVGGGYGNPTWIAEQMAESSGSRVGIGLITWNMADNAIETVLAHSPAAVWLSFGDPAPYVASIAAANARLICQVGSVAEAITAAEAGADVIVAQGNESGGHGQSNRALFGLLPAVVAAVGPIPVVAAGGIVGRQGYDAAVAFGASGVALGTAFYASTEALDADVAKQRLVDAGGDDTVRSVVYDIARGPEWPAEYSGRSLRTELTERWIGDEAEMRRHSEAIRESHRQAAAESDMSVRVVWAGEGIDGITGIRDAAEIVADFPAVGPSTAGGAQ